MNKVIEASSSLSYTSSSQPGPALKRIRRNSSTGFWIFLFLLPFLLLFIAFTLWPLVATIVYSLFDWNGIDALSSQNFVGLGNYQELLHDPLFWQSFWNTLLFALANTVIKLPLSLLLAIVLTRKWLWFKRFFRTVFFVPIILPVALAGQIFTILLNPSNGALDSVLLKIGLLKQPLDLLGNGTTALWMVVLISVWQIFGQYMLYWMAALQNVPEELYEAAQIDRASAWQQLTRITLPVIAPIGIVITLLGLVNALHVFGVVVTLTSGGPGTSSYVLSYYIYQAAFQNLPFRYGYASAAAVLFVVLAALFVLLQKRWGNDSANSSRVAKGGRV
ncbi:MAG TPA: sugar ABC transporter permease [Ktedonobacteraceae bacterium]|nr:sugar ABC transporter permease [Ktedonobacteraceae bacterium]